MASRKKDRLVVHCSRAIDRHMKGKKLCPQHQDVVEIFLIREKEEGSAWRQAYEIAYGSARVGLWASWSGESLIIIEGRQ